MTAADYKEIIHELVGAIMLSFVVYLLWSNRDI